MIDKDVNLSPAPGTGGNISWLRNFVDVQLLCRMEAVALPQQPSHS